MADTVNIIVTGGIETGKTTVCRQLVQMARADRVVCGGILTPLSNDGGKLVQDIASGAQVVLATRSGTGDGITVGRYFMHRQGIEFGQSAIYAARNADVLIIDELGALELKGDGFASAIDIINEGGIKNVVMVIRSKYISRFRRLLTVDATVFKVTMANREKIVKNIYLSLR
ncbi:MAG: nucleoside-triphosphatase [candidate division Zixibacteria bacterium]|nr:nucleoside-triphosphatase [candidate division Zixibacteria bacterium]